MFEQLPISVGRSIHPGGSHSCCLGSVTGFHCLADLNYSLPYLRTHGFSYTNAVLDQHSLYPGGQHTIDFYAKYMMAVEVSNEAINYVVDTMKV